MNAHDSERIKGMLEELGLGEATGQEEADVVVFNTCTIREKPDTKFAAHLAQAAALKRHDPDKVIAVGGCYAEAQQERLFELYPYVDVAFGPGSIPHLGEWLGAGGFGVPRGRFGVEERSFAGELPMHRERTFQAWVQISMGCNSKCSYCIVPAVRGREVSRRPGEVIAEVTRLAAAGVREITLLGQNVNSWGRDLAPDIRTEFGELLRACDAVDVVQRVAATRNAERIGRIEEVLVEGPSRTDPTLKRGRTRRNTTVNFTGTAAAGDLVEVRIEDATSTTLRGIQAVPVAA